MTAAQVPGWSFCGSGSKRCCEDSCPPPSHMLHVQRCIGQHSTSFGLLEQIECFSDLQAYMASHLHLYLRLQRPPQLPALFARLQPSTTLQQSTALRDRSCHPAAKLQWQHMPQAQLPGTLMPRLPSRSMPPLPGQGRPLCSSSRRGWTAEDRPSRSQLLLCLT